MFQDILKYFSWAAIWKVEQLHSGIIMESRGLWRPLTSGELSLFLSPATSLPMMIVMMMVNTAICHWLCHFTWFLLINTNCDLCVEFNCEHNDKYTAPNQLHVGVVFHQGINAMLCMIGNEVNAPTSSLSTTFQKVLGASAHQAPSATLWERSAII